MSARRLPEYEAFAECADCEWRRRGDVAEQASLQRAAEKHTRQEGHATHAGMCAFGESAKRWQERDRDEA